MGLKLSKPIKKPIKDGPPKQIVHKNSNLDKNSDKKLQDHNIKILKIVTEYVASYKDSESDVIENNRSSRAIGRKRPIERNNENRQTHYKRCKGLEDILTVFSINELIEYLEQCSNPTESPGRYDDLEMESTHRSPSEIVLNGSISQIEKLSRMELEPLLLNDNIHLDLVSNKDSTSKLIAVLDMATMYHILEEVLLIENIEKNNVTSMAFLKSNMQAFHYLIKKRHAKIPMYLNKEDRKYNFLNYIALHGKTSTGPTVDFLLLHLLEIIKETYNKDDIEKYLCDIDKEGLNLSLPHLLLDMYQDSPDLRQLINQCLKICLETCKSCIEVLCVSKYCSAYKFDLIAHAIILPVTNFEVIEMFMQLELSETEKMAYIDLINVHEDQSQKNRLLEIFNVSLIDNH